MATLGISVTVDLHVVRWVHERGVDRGAFTKDAAQEVPVTPVAAADAVLAQTGLVTAYNDAAAAPTTETLTGTDLGGLTLTPGVYAFSSSAQLTGTLTLDGQGSTNATFIFKIGSTLTTASNSSVLLINGGNPCGVNWQVGTSATLGTTTSFIGNLVALSSITLNTGADIIGRALARNGAVTLDANEITFAPCGAGGGPPPVPTLATWALIALVGLLALAGLTSLRRRQAGTLD